MRKPLLAAAVATATAVALLTAPGSPAVGAPSAPDDYTVVAADGVASDAAVAAITAAGGTVVSRNDAVGVYRVSTNRSDFRAEVAESAALIGATERRPVGYAPKAPAIERPTPGVRAGSAKKGPKMDPLDDKLWGLSMIR